MGLYRRGHLSLSMKYIDWSVRPALMLPRMDYCRKSGHQGWGFIRHVLD